MRANILIHVYRLPPTEAGFRRSALDVGKMRVFIAQGKGVPKCKIWQANGQGYRSRT